jgi:hypothetical protein
MNITTHTSSVRPVGRFALATTLAAIVLGATACGSEEESVAAPTAALHKTTTARTQPLDTIDLIERARAEHADAMRQAHDRLARKDRTAMAHHSPGFDKALLAER